MKVEGKGIEISRRARAGENKGMSKELEFLDVLVQIGRTPGGFPFLETGVYRKESAADMYISSTSYHPQSLKVGGTPVIVPHKPGVDEWWQKCRRQGTVDLEGLEEGEKGFLPDRLLKCMKGTSKLSQMLGKKNKRQEEGEEK